jgi:signal transduction histidine kinase
VAWIVKAHAATIEVDSTFGKGTRFTIHFPAENVDSGALELVGHS